MVKGLGVASMQKNVSLPQIDNLKSPRFECLNAIWNSDTSVFLNFSANLMHLCLVCYRLDNSGLSEESYQVKLRLNQPAIESEYSPKTPSLLDPNSGMR